MINASQNPLEILIVEDQPLIAMDIQFIVEDAGHNVAALAASLFDVEDLANGEAPDLAFVDVQLARGTSGLDVCSLIVNRWPGTLIVFITANPKKIPDDFAGAHGIIAKPFSAAGLSSALRFLECITQGHTKGLVVPDNLIAAPQLLAMMT